MARNGRRAHGEGGLYQRDNGLWVVTIEEGFEDGKRRRWQATSRTQAGALEKRRKALERRARYGVMGSASLTVGQWLNRWLDEFVDPTLKPRTAHGYRCHVERDITPRIGRRRLLELTPGNVEAMLRAVAAHPDRKGNPRAATARACHRVLRSALSDAEREGLVPRNVAVGADVPASRPVKPTLTPEQVRTIATAVDPMRARWLAALDAGLRQGEALGLEWDRVDFDAGTIAVDWQLQRIAYRHGCGTRSKAGDWPCGRRFAGDCDAKHLPIPADQEARVLAGGLVLTRPKSANGVRVVSMTKRLSKALAAHRKRTGVIAGLVWTDDGRPIDPRADAKAWAGMLERLEIPHVGLHSARRTTATVLRDQGVDVTVIRDMLGHGDIEQTRAYQQVGTEQGRAAAAAFEKATS